MNDLTVKVSAVLTQLDIKVLFDGLKCNSKDHTLLIEDETGGNVMIYMLSTNQARSHQRAEWKTISRERYIFSDGKKWIAVENSTGDAWMEDFETMAEAIFWLANANYGADEIRIAANSKKEISHATS